MGGTGNEKIIKTLADPNVSCNDRSPFCRNCFGGGHGEREGVECAGGIYSGILSK